MCWAKLTNRDPETTGIRKGSGSGQSSCSGMDPLVHIRRKNTKQSGRSGRDQSPNPDKARTTKQSRTPERTRTPERARTLDRTKTLDRGKAPMSQVSLAPAPDCMIVDQWVAPPSQEVTDKEHRATSVFCSRNMERIVGSNHSHVQSSRKKRKVLGTVSSRLGDGSWEG